jgi:serine/threonine protein kinase
MGRALLTGIPEILERLDVLAGRRLVYVADVRRQPSGGWLIERYDLTGEAPRRLEALGLPDSEAARLPRPERLYLEAGAPAAPGQGPFTALHPLVIYDAEAGEALFLNARRGRHRAEYLGYGSGRVLEREDLDAEQRELLAHVLTVPVDAGQVQQWSAWSLAEEAPAPEQGGPATRSIGEFELLSKLGQGGMGVVYRAWQPSLGRQVALKCLLRSGDRAEARFAREIRALGRVEHPHLVKVFTSGSDGDQWFYAMELIEGATLATVCEKLQTRTTGATQVDLKTWQETLSTVCEETRRSEQPLSDAVPEAVPPIHAPAEDRPIPTAEGRSYVRHVVELVRQVAEAAHALHEAGVVHRDIKPGNILVDPGGGDAVLMDLGLAQLMDETQGKLTRTRQFVGTLRYASPEQILAAGNLDRRSDVYSLGVTLWELLTLRPMYGATEETPTPALMQQIQYDEPERLPKYNRSIPADLEAVVMKCLEKSPARRYGTARNLADDLGRWLRGEPVRARPLTLPYVASKFIRRHRGRLALVAGLVALQVVLVLGLLRLLGSGGPPPAPPGPEGEGPTLSGPDAPPGRRRGLLVGCTKFDKLDKLYQLRGSANDVRLVQKLLVDQFQFAEGDIVRLVEDEGEDRRPTRANINREVRHLADTAQPGDQVVIYLAGSGTRLPAPPGQPSLEGLVNVFLPADAGRWDDARKEVPNAITGLEFAEWARPIVQHGALVWTICDICHGGFGSESEWPAGAVFLYAAQPSEETWEKEYGGDDPEAGYHGVFTYTLYQILKQDSTLTYTQLVNRVQIQYSARNGRQATPWVIGRDRYHRILGPAQRSGLSRLQVQSDVDGRLRLNAGSLHGLSQGMILQVWDLTPSGQARSVVGHVRVTAVKDDDARVQPCPYAGLDARSNLPVVNRCEPVYVEYGDARLKVGFALITREEEPTPVDKQRNLSAQMQALLKDDVPEAEWVSDARQADVLVQLKSADSDQVYLVPTSPALAEKADTRGLERVFPDRPVLFGPVPVTDIRGAVKETLHRIARARNLVTLVDRLEGEQENSDVRLDLELKLVRYRDKADQAGQVDWRDRAINLRPDEQIAFLVDNHSPDPVDVTLLRVKPDASIVVLFTTAGEDSAEKTLLTPRMRMAGDTDAGGREEHVLLIAVKRQGPGADFSFLAEPSLARARERVKPGTAEQTLDSPLGRLAQKALYAEGDLRGIDLKALSRYRFAKISWQVVLNKGQEESEKPRALAPGPKP